VSFRDRRGGLVLEVFRQADTGSGEASAEAIKPLDALWRRPSTVARFPEVDFQFGERTTGVAKEAGEVRGSIASEAFGHCT